MLSPPQAGEPVDQLWKHVAELVKKVNALENMRVTVTAAATKDGISGGKLAVHDSDSVLSLN
jgi:hypothetical protein